MSRKLGKLRKSHIRLFIPIGIILVLVSIASMLWLLSQHDGIPFQLLWTKKNEKKTENIMPPTVFTPNTQLAFSKTAWVDTSVLAVQAWPSTGNHVLAEILRGQEVRVVGESNDGQWSLLDQPVEGWVRTEHLHFSEKGISPRLTPASFRTYRWVKAKPRLRVRFSPDTNSEIVTHVAHGELVEIDKFTNDLEWAHIIAPEEGWCSTRYLSLKPVKE